MFEDYVSKTEKMIQDFKEAQVRFQYGMKNLVVSWGEKYLLNPLKARGIPEEEINLLFDQACRKANNNEKKNQNIPYDFELIYYEFKKLVKEKYNII